MEHREPMVEDDIEGLIGAYDGDAKAVIKALLKERQMLIQQIEMLLPAASIGFLRGKKPNLPMDC